MRQTHPRSRTRPTTMAEGSGVMTTGNRSAERTADDISSFRIAGCPDRWLTFGELAAALADGARIVITATEPGAEHLGHWIEPP